MDNIEPEEALDLKKKIMRYLHARYFYELINRLSLLVHIKMVSIVINKSFISWALVMTQRGGEIRKQFRYDDSYVTKGLLTVEEDQYLKVDYYSRIFNNIY